ncbi:MAG: type IV secretory system conjugative DNA transfer family protein [Filomicrobium sp.]
MWGVISLLFGLVLSVILLAWRGFRLLCKLVGITFKYSFITCQWLLGNDSDSFGTARFARNQELKSAGFLNDQGLLLGEVANHELHSGIDEHLLCVAPTKSGKTSSLVIPNLLRLPEASVVVNDPSGEAWAITRRQRAKSGRVYCWAPFAPLTDCFNPLDFVQVGTPDEHDDVKVIVSLLVQDGGQGDDTFWNNQARNVLSGLIIYVLYAHPPERQTMAQVRHLLTISEEAFDEVLGNMIACGHPLARRTANNIQQMDSKLRSGVLATAKGATEVWDSPRLTQATRKSDFNFGDLRMETASVYLVVPPERLATYYPAVALLAGLSIAAISRVAHQGNKRVVFMLDEFANLGRLKPAEAAITIARKAGIQLCLFVQDFAQLRRVYGDTSETFSANCAAKVYFGVNEIRDAETVSKTLGTKTVNTRSSGHYVGLTDVMPERLNAGSGEAGRALRTPDEVMNLNRDECLICHQSVRPILARKVFYQDKRFKGLWDAWDGRPPHAELLDFQEAFVEQQRGKLLALPQSTVILLPDETDQGHLTSDESDIEASAA